MSSDVRAVLVSHADVSNAHTDAGLPAFREALRDRFNAAADQPRIRWCVKHGAEVLTTDGECWLRDWHRRISTFGHDADAPKPCRVVDALVVPLPEASE